MQKNTLTKIMLAGVSAATLLVTAVVAQAAVPNAANWNVTGAYGFNLNYQGTDYPTNMTLLQDNSGNVTGTGSNPQGYAWTITSGSVSGDTIMFTANYTAKPDAVTPVQTVLNMTGTITATGISGTWTDNYLGGSRNGTWVTTSGVAASTNVTLSSTYTISALTGGTATISDVPYGTTKATFLGNITPGQANQTQDASMVSDPVMTGDVLTVTAQDHQTVGTYTVNVNPVPTNNPTTLAATNVGASDATLNATNGTSDADAVSFWASTSPFVTTSPTLPSGVYSTPALPAVSANGSYSAQLSSVVGLPAITTGTTYYVVAWSEVGGTWYPGASVTFTTGSTGSGTISGTVTQPVGVLAVTSVTPVKTNSIADGTFANGWVYTFNVTVPTNEPKFQMSFADWTDATSDVLPVAGNMQISSAQAANTSPVTLTAANTYSTVLNMTGDLDPTTPGMQVQVKVEVAVPSGTVNGSYTTSYAIQTNQ
jgi:hypothetical protein